MRRSRYRRMMSLTRSNFASLIRMVLLRGALVESLVHLARGLLPGAEPDNSSRDPRCGAARRYIFEHDAASTDFSISANYNVAEHTRASAYHNAFTDFWV